MAGTDPPEAFCDSARAVWSNAVIREAIIERAPTSVLVTLLRVDRDALRRAVGQLYRSIRDEPALKARLMDVRNSTRFSCYTQAVRHLDNLAWPNFNISILRQQYPQLRSFSALSGLTEFGSCKWDVDDHGHAVDVVFTLDSWGRKAFWGRRVEGVKRVLPDDWNIAFRPREVHLKSADDINRWIAESEAGTIGVPALIGIFWLAESELAILHDYIRSRGWGRQDIDLKVDLRDEGGKVTVPSDIATSDKLRQTLLAWKGIPKSLELYGVEWQAETLSVWSHLLAAYPRLKLELTSAPWSKQRMPSRHFATRISEMFNLSTLPKRVDVNVGLDIYSDDFPAPTGRKDAVRTIMQDRTWIHDLARTLLALAGPLGRHAVTIGPKDYWRPNGFDPDICGAHFHINELITTLLNDTIATIVECRREDMPAGFHRLERHDHKHPSGVSSPVGD